MPTINCDQMWEWDYDNCYSCKNFNHNVSPRRWSCKLNRSSAVEKREFQTLWALEFLRTHGMEISEDRVIVNYVGKSRRNNKKEPSQ